MQQGAGANLSIWMGNGAHRNTLDWAPVHMGRTHTITYRAIQSSMILTAFYQRELELLREAPGFPDMGKTDIPRNDGPDCFPQLEIQPKTFLLWGDSATHQATH